MKAIIFLANNVKHRVVPEGGYTLCGKRFIEGQPCPDKPTHLIIFPNCPNHVPPTKCKECYDETLSMRE